MSKFRRAEKLEDVSDRIHEVLEYCREEHNPLGYFAALYTKVAKSIETAVHQEKFIDNDQLARMDVNFVNYYIDAMNCAVDGTEAPRHWDFVIRTAENDQYLVLEHLFIAMNAHINYDLCNAVCDSVDPAKILDFKADFMQVNSILFSLLDNVQNDVSVIFHPLKWYLRFGQQLDDKIIALVMGHMRNDAFGFSCTLALCNDDHKSRENSERMEHVLGLSQDIINHRSWLINLIIRMVRQMEIGTVKSKIEQLLK